MRTSEPRTVSVARCAVLTHFPLFLNLTSRKKANYESDYYAQLTAAVLITNVREPPNVPQIHRESND